MHTKKGKAMRLFMVVSLLASAAALQTTFVRRNGARTARCLAASASSSENAFWSSRTKCWRPTVNDVERISWGKPAKKKGTGSRGVPHRLNQEEREAFDRARRRGFLEVAGSAWRAQRRGAPLLNSYRSLCDARGQPCIVLHKGVEFDSLVLDLSPLRLPESFADVAASCAENLEIQPNEVIAEMSADVESITESQIDVHTDDGFDPWETQPIYHLSPYYVSWELPRPEAKTAGKMLSKMFDTSEPKAAKARKPVGVRPGKSRRHGGYGIG